MSSAAAAPVIALPIDELIWHLEEAAVQITEIESRRNGIGLETRSLEFRYPRAATVEQHQRIRDCRGFVDAALRLAREYAKGPYESND